MHGGNDIWRRKFHREPTPYTNVDAVMDPQWAKSEHEDERDRIAYVNALVDTCLHR